MATIVRRRASFSGQITQNSYNEAQFYVKGTDIMEVARDIQRDVFAFVADTGDVVRATFLVETGPEELLDRSEISGVARFVGVPAASDARYKAEVTTVEVVMEGQFVEGGKGTFYVDGNMVGRRGRLSSSSEAIGTWDRDLQSATKDPPRRLFRRRRLCHENARSRTLG